MRHFGNGIAARRAYNACLRAAVFGATILTSGAIAWADDGDFFRGKSVTVVVSYPPGGGYDTYARLMASHFGQYVAGQPKIIVQNMPGASGITASNYFIHRAPRDGTALLAFSSSAAFARTFGNEAAAYKADDFTYIGNFDQATGTCVVSAASGITSFDDILRRQAMFGASGPSGVDSEYARALNALFGTRIKLIHGYGGSPSVNLGVQRREIEGGCGYMLSSLQSVFREDFTSGRIKPIVQFARKSEELASVPHVRDFARSVDDKAVYDLIFSRDILGRPIAGPPELPAARTAMLRAAFDALIGDPAFREAATKAKLPLTSMNGAEVETFVRGLMAATPDAVSRARAALVFRDNDQLRTLEGTILAIDGIRFRVRHAGGETHNVLVSDSASKILIDGQQAERGRLKVGMPCVLRYLNDGDVAEAISCR